MARRILASLALGLGLIGLSGAATATTTHAQGNYVGPTGTMITGGSVSTGTQEVYFNRGEGQTLIIVTSGNAPSSFMRVYTAPTDDGSQNCSTFGRGC